MKLLYRYMFRTNALLLLLTLTMGAALYLLTDAVERADIFLGADTGIGLAVTFFLAKIPGIISQILPAVFFLSCVVQLCLMARNREMVALSAGGLSSRTLTVALVLCGLFWGGVQLVFSQYLGSWGDARAASIWEEQVRKRDRTTQSVNQIWFTEKGYVVDVDSIYRDGTGTNVTAYEMSEDLLSFKTITRAPGFYIAPDGWHLVEAVRLEPDKFIETQHTDLLLPLEQQADIFFLNRKGSKPQQLPLWQLNDAIQKLGMAGANVEGLRTAWHGKVAYAASLMVLAVLAVALVSWEDTMYMAVGLAIIMILVSYSLIMFGDSLGQRGIVPPMLAAWGPLGILLAASMLRLRLKE